MSKFKIMPPVRDNFKIDTLIKKPQNIGEILEDRLDSLEAKLFKFTFGDCKYGFKLNIYWALNRDEQIVDCQIEPFGEAELIAVASIAGLVVRNKTPKEVLNLKEKGLEYFLRENPNNTALPIKLSYITNLTIYALHQAAKSYLKEELDNSQIFDEDLGLSIDYIKWTIKENNIKNLDDLINKSGATIFSQSCQQRRYQDFYCNQYLEDILNETLKELEAKQVSNQDILEKDFKTLSDEEKKIAVEAIIDKHVRQMLIMDGGDMEILDVKTNGEDTDVYIRYLGACSGCASADTGTLFAIEGILKQKLDKNIRVIPL